MKRFHYTTSTIAGILWVNERNSIAATIKQKFPSVLKIPENYPDLSLLQYKITYVVMVDYIHTTSL